MNKLAKEKYKIRLSFSLTYKAIIILKGFVGLVERTLIGFIIFFNNAVLHVDLKKVYFREKVTVKKLWLAKS